MGYGLHLTDGQSWILEAEPGMGPWLDAMASVMNLKRNRSVEALRIRIVEGYSAGCKDPQAVEMKESQFLGISGLGEGKELDLGLIRFSRSLKGSHIICRVASVETDRRRYTQMRLFVSILYHEAVHLGGIPLHAGLVERDGWGILLAAPGNTGKSTCCNRIPAPWRAICDDEALVVSLDENRYAVHPFPTWSEYVENRSKPTWDIETEIPLKAVFCLEQGNSDETVPLGQAAAAVRLAGLAREEVLPSWVKLGHLEKIPIRQRLFENACSLASSVPAYRLRATLSGEFWKEMEKVL